MDDPARPVPADRLAERRGIRDVAPNVGNRSRFVAEQQPQPPRIGREVERHDLAAGPDELVHDPRADAAVGSRHEDPIARHDDDPRPQR